MDTRYGVDESGLTKQTGGKSDDVDIGFAKPFGGFVGKHYARVLYQRAGNKNAPSLFGRKLFGFAVQKFPFKARTLHCPHNIIG